MELSIRFSKSCITKSAKTDDKEEPVCLQNSSKVKYVEFNTMYSACKTSSLGNTIR